MSHDEPIKKTDEPTKQFKIPSEVKLPSKTRLNTVQPEISHDPACKTNTRAGNRPLEFEDFLTPEQRVNILADVFSDIALRMARKAASDTNIQADRSTR